MLLGHSWRHHHNTLPYRHSLPHMRDHLHHSMTQYHYIEYHNYRWSWEPIHTGIHMSPYNHSHLEGNRLLIELLTHNTIPPIQLLLPIPQKTASQPVIHTIAVFPEGAAVGALVHEAPSSQHTPPHQQSPSQEAWEPFHITIPVQRLPQSQFSPVVSPPKRS